MRPVALFALVLLAACGGAPAATTITPSASTSTVADTTTTTATTAATASTTTMVSTTTTVPRVRPEGRDAPDFTLTLGEGGTFTLGEDHRPVFLLFWAEW